MAETFMHLMVAAGAVTFAAWPTFTSVADTKSDLAQCLTKRPGKASKGQKAQTQASINKQCNDLYKVDTGFKGVMKLYGGYIILGVGFIVVLIVARGGIGLGMGGGGYSTY